MPRKTQDTVEKRKPKKNTKKATNKKKENQVEETKDNKFSFDEEIVIGLRRIDEPKEPSRAKKQHTKNKKNNNKKSSNKDTKKLKENKSAEDIIKSKNIENYDDGNEVTKRERKNIKKVKSKVKPKKVLTKKQELAKKRRKLVFKIIKWLTLIAIIIAGIIYAMLSPIFNIANIEVNGNSKISSESIISLSGLKVGQNIFNFRTSNIVDNIKQNAYIDSVQINRSLPDTIRITVEERVTTFMLSFGNAYVYINNQGYILEITSEKGEYPLLIGYETPEEDIQEGNRLCTNDLEKLSDILKIMEAATSGDNKIRDLITEIDMTDSSDYVLRLDSEKKTVHLGDISNLSTKILWINEFLKSEEGNEGIIYLNVNLNTERPYFREKV